MRRQIVVLLAVMAMVLTSATVAGAKASKNTSDVYTLPGFALVDGASVDSVITPGGVRIKMRTNGVTSGNAYTLWSISFSNPEECAHGVGAQLCGPGDDGPGPQGFAVQQVGGNIAGASGNLTIAGRVTVDDAVNAEYHVVLADHGPKDPAQLPAQIKTPGPGVQIGFLLP